MIDLAGNPPLLLKRSPRQPIDGAPRSGNGPSPSCAMPTDRVHDAAATLQLTGSGWFGLKNDLSSG
jgi:hypothetical protein